MTILDNDQLRILDLLLKDRAECLELYGDQSEQYKKADEKYQTAKNALAQSSVGGVK